jgi:thioesterase domain-containing protein
MRYGRIVVDPLTGRTGQGARAGVMAVALLAYANRAKVAEALTAQGYPVTRVTVNRWANGADMPEIAARMILELFGHTPETTKEAAPPEWAERLADDAANEVVRQLVDLLIPEDEARRVATLAGQLRALSQLRREAPPERTDESAQGPDRPEGPAGGSPRSPNGTR